MASNGKGRERDGGLYSSRPICDSAKLDIKIPETMPDEEAEKCRGERMAVAGGKIVAHGRDPERVHERGCGADRGVPHMECTYASPEVTRPHIPKE